MTNATTKTTILSRFFGTVPPWSIYRRIIGKFRAGLSGTRHGFILTPELIILFIIASLLLSYAMVEGIKRYNDTKIEQTYESIFALSASIKRLFHGQGNYSDLTNAVVISSKAAPPTLIKGKALTAPIGAAITVAPASDGSTFTITLSSLDKSSCTFLATNQLDGWQSVSVNNNVINKSSAVAGATAACNDSGNSVTFVDR